MPTGLGGMGSSLQFFFHLLELYSVSYIDKTIHCDKISVIMSKMLLGLRAIIKEEEEKREPLDCCGWVWSAEFQPLQVSGWVWSAESQPLQVSGWVWSAESQPLQGSGWVWSAESQRL
jgi:hypothetical protein